MSKNKIKSKEIKKKYPFFYSTELFLEPNFNFYFSPDGRLYPCAAYYYNDFNIPYLYYHDIDPEQAYNKFSIFAYEYCKFHRESKDTDHKRCCLECGIDKTFKFDTFEEIIN